MIEEENTFKTGMHWLTPGIQTGGCISNNLILIEFHKPINVTSTTPKFNCQLPVCYFTRACHFESRADWQGVCTGETQTVYVSTICVPLIVTSHLFTLYDQIHGTLFCRVGFQLVLFVSRNDKSREKDGTIESPLVFRLTC